MEIPSKLLSRQQDRKNTQKSFLKYDLCHAQNIFSIQILEILTNSYIKKKIYHKENHPDHRCHYC